MWQSPHERDDAPGAGASQSCNLDTATGCLRHQLCIGSLHTAVARIGRLFRPLFASMPLPLSLSTITHQSDPSPSPEDIGITRQLITAGKLLDIEVLDHIIIGHQLCR